MLFTNIYIVLLSSDKLTKNLLITNFSFRMVNVIYLFISINFDIVTNHTQKISQYLMKITVK